MNIRNWIRDYLGVTEELQNISKVFDSMGAGLKHVEKTTFELFQAMPYAAAIYPLTAKDAAAITVPQIMANSLPALLTGILMNARMGNSAMQIEGELSPEVREALEARGFKVEENQGAKETGLFVLWT